jgi:hypothetical protein
LEDRRAGVRGWRERVGGVDGLIQVNCNSIINSNAVSGRLVTCRKS